MMALLSIGYRGRGHLHCPLACIFNCLSPWPAPADDACEQGEESNTMQLHVEDDGYGKGLDRWRATTLCHVNRHMNHCWSCHPVPNISIAAGEFNQYNRVSKKKNQYNHNSPSGLEKDLVRFFSIFPFSWMHPVSSISTALKICLTCTFQ